MIVLLKIPTVAQKKDRKILAIAKDIKNRFAPVGKEVIKQLESNFLKKDYVRNGIII